MTKTVTTFKEVNSLGFDMKKTEELLEGLKNDGLIVGIEDLSQYIRKQGVIVQESIGRKRNYITVSPKLFGVDLKTKGSETNEFFKQHMKMGQIRFLPDIYETKLVNLEVLVRQKRRTYALGYDDKFMTIETYKKFMELVETKKEEYLATRDEIVENWDSIISRFRTVLWSTLDELQSIEKEKVFNKVMNSLPSKEQYAESFYMDVNAKAFPVTENLEMFSEDIQEQIKDGLHQDTIETLYDIIGNTLDDGFDAVSRVIKSIKKEDNLIKKIAHKTLGSLIEAGKRIGEKNIFNNPKVESIRISIVDLANLSINPEVMCEEAEAISAMIYGYARELGIENKINTSASPLSEIELLDLFDMLEGTNSQEEQEGIVVSAEMFKMRA